MTLLWLRLFVRLRGEDDDDATESSGPQVVIVPWLPWWIVVGRERAEKEERDKEIEKWKSFVWSREICGEGTNERTNDCDDCWLLAPL